MPKVAMIGQKGMPAIFGGVERHVHELAIRVVQHGYKPTVYSRSWYTGTKQDSELEGVKIKHVPTIHSKHFDAIIHSFFATIHAIRSGHDILHYHGVGPSLVSWIPRLFAPRIRVVTTFHCIDRKHAKWGFFARMILRLGEFTSCVFAHKTIAVSHQIRLYTRDSYDCDSVFIPNGVPLYDRIKETKQIEKFRLTPDNYILAVSRLVGHKGIHYLIDAYKQLKADKPELIGDKKLVIVGDGAHTEDYVNQLKDSAKDDKDIVFTGFQNGDMLAELFSHTYLYVHPSDNEGLPITVLEAMSYSLPILVSDIPEHKQLIDDKDYLFAQGDVSALKTQLVNIMNKSNFDRERAGYKNRKKIEREYTWTDVVRQVSTLYADELAAVHKDQKVTATAQ